MSQDEEAAGPAGQEESRPGQGETRAPGAGRLPPPAFPPGARRRLIHLKITESSEELGDAIISPDEPMPARGDVPEAAFISPDEPIVRGEAGVDAPIVRRDSGVATPRVQVTGIGPDTRLDPFELTASRDPYVRELVEQVSRLAEALKRRGEAGLRTTPGMPRFEATLRAYCVGYLHGRRAEKDGK